MSIEKHGTVKVSDHEGILIEHFHFKNVTFYEASIEALEWAAKQIAEELRYLKEDGLQPNVIHNADPEPMDELKAAQIQIRGLTKGLSSLEGKVRSTHRQLTEAHQSLHKRRLQAAKDSGQINKLFAQLFMAKRDLGCTLPFETWKDAWLYSNGYKHISEEALRTI